MAYCQSGSLLILGIRLSLSLSSLSSSLLGFVRAPTQPVVTGFYWVVPVFFFPESRLAFTSTFTRHCSAIRFSITESRLPPRIGGSLDSQL